MPGKWIQLKETPSEFFVNGTPEIGDIVELLYDSKTTPVNSYAVRSGASTYKNKDYIVSAEDGIDTIYSGEDN